MSQLVNPVYNGITCDKRKYSWSWSLNLRSHGSWNRWKELYTLNRFSISTDVSKNEICWIISGIVLCFNEDCWRKNDTMVSVMGSYLLGYAEQLETRQGILAAKAVPHSCASCGANILDLYGGQNRGGENYSHIIVSNSKMKLSCSLYHQLEANCSF